jgi:hypothetical protein
VLSDHHASKGQGKADLDRVDAEHEDIGAIGRILQKALHTSKAKQLQRSTAVGQSLLILDTVNDAIRLEEM